MLQPAAAPASSPFVAVRRTLTSLSPAALTSTCRKYFVSSSSLMPAPEAPNVLVPAASAFGPASVPRLVPGSPDESDRMLTS